jgi:hypothetical protein
VRQVAFVCGYGCLRQCPHDECGHVAELQRLAGSITQILVSLSANYVDACERKSVKKSADNKIFLCRPAQEF